MLYQGGIYFDSHCTILNPQNTILKPQNTSLITQTTILTWENTILNPQNTILKPQNTNLISQTTILTLENTIPNPQNTILKPQNTILKPQNTICLDSNHHEQLCLHLPLLLWWFAVPNQTGAGLLSTTSTYSWVITPLFLLFFFSDHWLKSHNGIHYHYQEHWQLLYATHNHYAYVGVCYEQFRSVWYS